MIKFIESKGSSAKAENIHNQTVSYGSTSVGKSYIQMIKNEWYIGCDAYCETILYDDEIVANIRLELNGVAVKQTSYIEYENGGWGICESCEFGVINTMTFGEMGTDTYYGILVFNDSVMLGYLNTVNEYESINGNDIEVVCEWQQKLGIYSDSMLNLFS